MKTIPIVTQNVDRNVSSRDYPANKVLVTSFFLTLQGEGRFAGWPAIFVRLAGCNYGSKTDMCSWCDTSFQFDQAKAYDAEALLSELMRIPGYDASQILVITGGEPTLQLEVLTLIVKAKSYFKAIQIETNGTQPKFFAEADARGLSPRDFVTVVSPKANERLRKYPALHPTVQWWASDFKYVLSSDPESMHHVLPELALEMAKAGRSVYVSPMAIYKKAYAGEVSSIWDPELIDQASTARNYAYAADYTIKNKLRLSLQTHLITAIP